MTVRQNQNSKDSGNKAKTMCWKMLESSTELNGSVKYVCVFSRRKRRKIGEWCFVLLTSSVFVCIWIWIWIREWMMWETMKVCLTLLNIMLRYVHTPYVENVCLRVTRKLKGRERQGKTNKGSVRDIKRVKEERNGDKFKERDKGSESLRERQQLTSRLIWHLQLHAKYQNILPKFSHCWVDLLSLSQLEAGRHQFKNSNHEPDRIFSSRP